MMAVPVPVLIIVVAIIKCFGRLTKASMLGCGNRPS